MNLRFNSIIQLLLLLLIYSINNSLANNSIYINLSNNIARKEQLRLLTNNIANLNTTGYEADEVLLGTKLKIENSKKSNAFTTITRSFLNQQQLPSRSTNRSLDITVRGGYLKVLTPNGPRYTLNGHIQVDNQGVLVHSLSYPYLTTDNDQIVLANPNSNNIFINSHGVVFCDARAIGQLGIFTFPDKFALVKEGNGLYYTKKAELLAKNFTVTNRSLALSNVNGDKTVKDLMEVQNSMDATTQMIRLISKLERDTIRRLTN